MSQPWALQTPEQHERHRLATKKYNDSHKAERRAYYDANKASISAYWKKHYEEHGPRISPEGRRRWWRANPDKNTAAVQRRRARIQASPVLERFTRHEIYVRDGGICQICRQPVTEKASVQDHIYPLSRGGEHTRANIQLACRSCNSHKRDKLPEELVA